MVDMSGHLIHISSSSFQGISITDLRHINFTYFNLFSSLNSCVTLGDRTNNHWFQSSFDSPIASFTSRKPLTLSLPTVITSVILLTLCHTIHVWLVRRIWLCFNSIFFPVLFCLILYRCCEDIGHPWDRQVKASPMKYLLICAKSSYRRSPTSRNHQWISTFSLAKPTVGWDGILCVPQCFHFCSKKKSITFKRTITSHYLTLSERRKTQFIWTHTGTLWSTASNVEIFLSKNKMHRCCAYCCVLPSHCLVSSHNAIFSPLERERCVTRPNNSCKRDYAYCQSSKREEIKIICIQLVALKIYLHVILLRKGNWKPLWSLPSVWVKYVIKCRLFTRN